MEPPLTRKINCLGGERSGAELPLQRWLEYLGSLWPPVATAKRPALWPTSPLGRRSQGGRKEAGHLLLSAAPHFPPRGQARGKQRSCPRPLAIVRPLSPPRPWPQPPSQQPTKMNFVRSNRPIRIFPHAPACGGVGQGKLPFNKGEIHYKAALNRFPRVNFAEP